MAFFQIDKEKLLKYPMPNIICLSLKHWIVAKCHGVDGYCWCSCQLRFDWSFWTSTKNVSKYYKYSNHTFYHHIRGKSTTTMFPSNGLRCRLVLFSACHVNAQVLDRFCHSGHTFLGGHGNGQNRMEKTGD